MEDPIGYIRECLTQEELLAQLAEECTELAKAALKLRRVLDRRNPTPVKRREAYDALLEEIADVKLCLHVCGYENVNVLIACNRTVGEKAQRWASRLQEVSQ